MFRSFAASVTPSFGNAYQVTFVGMQDARVAERRKVNECAQGYWNPREFISKDNFGYLLSGEILSTSSLFTTIESLSLRLTECSISNLSHTFTKRLLRTKSDEMTMASK
jgi:hypothetical protein